MLLAFRHSLKPCSLSLPCSSWKSSGRQMLFTHHEEKSHKHLRSYLIFCLQKFREVLRTSEVQRGSALPCRELTKPEQPGSRLRRPLLIFECFFLYALFFLWIHLSSNPLMPWVGASVCKRHVLLFCCYVADYVLEFWFRLVISNIIVG